MKNRNLDHKDDWATPVEFLKDIVREFGGFFDPCPLHHNMSWDGLEIEWGGVNFCNPPYSQKLKDAFVKKAIEESKKGKTCIVLLPVSTSTKLFHNYILPNKKEIRFLKGRLRFKGINSKGQYVNFPIWNDDTILNKKGEPIPKYIKNSGMHDSMLVIF